MMRNRPDQPPEPQQPADKRAVRDDADNAPVPAPAEAIDLNDPEAEQLSSTSDA